MKRGNRAIRLLRAAMIALQPVVLNATVPVAGNGTDIRVVVPGPETELPSNFRESLDH